jgi:hypothetical protein
VATAGGAISASERGFLLPPEHPAAGEFVQLLLRKTFGLHVLLGAIAGGELIQCADVAAL